MKSLRISVISVSKKRDTPPPPSPLSMKARYKRYDRESLLRSSCWLSLYQFFLVKRMLQKRFNFCAFDAIHHALYLRQNNGPV